MTEPDFFIGGGQTASGGSRLAVIKEGIGFPLREVSDVNASGGGTTPVDVIGDVTAEIGQFLSVTCSIADITVTLPDPTLLANVGQSIWIHKVDDTDFVILTSVKDIAFQNSTMHLISNGISWVIS
jgi:hypothetical protein